MAVAKKAKKDGVEVKIETSNDAQKDKKHSKRKTKTATSRLPVLRFLLNP